MTPDFSAARVYTDFSGLSELKVQARSNTDAAAKEVARQFEGIMLQMMLKSMREASLGEGLFDSDQVQQSQEMYDKQLALSLSESGGLGLAEAIVRQITSKEVLSGRPSGMGIGDYSELPAMPVSQAKSAEASDIVPAQALSPNSDQRHDSPESFVRAVWPAAKSAAEELGTTPEVLVAQAALETGWGNSVIRDRQGNNSFNLFAIKADHRWSGDHVRVSTLEYESGIAVQKQENFRAYDSYESAFQDYVSFIQGGARYSNALEVADDPQAYVSALQDAGYATDPAYANKIIRVMNSDTLNSALSSLTDELS